MASPVVSEQIGSPRNLLERQTSSDRTHHCSTCSKSFKRREHYQRHVRSHTNEKPFPCRYCGKCYSRKDLVTRHEKTLHSAKRNSLTANAATPADIAECFWTGIPATPSIQNATFDALVDHELWNTSTFAHSDLPLQLDRTEYANGDGHSEADYTMIDPALTALDSPNENHPDQETASVSAALSPSVAPEPSSPGAEVNIPTEALASTLNQITLSSISGYDPPSLEALRLCMSTYFQTFNLHLPLFHTPTFDCAQQPPELILMMAAIGALYRLERRTATYLYLAAESRTASEPLHPDLTYTELFYSGNLVEPNLGPERNIGLAGARTQFLLSFFAIFSGNQEVVESAFGRLGKLSNAHEFLFRQVRSRSSKSDSRSTSWLEWVDLECCSRLLHSIWVLSNLLSTTYGIAPAFSVSHHGDVELPCSEALWQAQSYDEWRVIRSEPRTFSSLSLREAVDILTHGTIARELPEAAYTWSHFAVVVIMHTMAIHIWHGGHASSKDASVYSSALQRCRHLIRATGEAQCGDWLESRPSFLFNASCILRICYGRSHSALPHLDRTALLRGQPDAVSTAIHEYIVAPMTRSKTMTETIAGVFDGLCSPDRRSLLLLRKTVALTWSFEHAIAAWDTVLIVSRWIHNLEHIPPRDRDEDENRLLDHILTILRAAGCDFSESKSKAAVMMRLWATFCEDTWVWGVVARMGAIYRSLANAYESSSND